MFTVWVSKVLALTGLQGYGFFLIFFLFLQQHNFSNQENVCFNALEFNTLKSHETKKQMFCYQEFCNKQSPHGQKWVLISSFMHI